MKWFLLFMFFSFTSAYAQTPITDYKDPVLNFYSVNDAYGEFSNFASYPIVVDGVDWPTSEHYYQAHKYTDPDLMERVRHAKSPMEAAKIGRDPTIPKRLDWDVYKDIAMETALRAKFEQYEYLKNLLKSTNATVLHEHTKNDIYWGDGGDGTGKDKLGQLLMKLRSEY
jgi:ribA/ribD-fused uncharacterized protein